MMIRLRHTLILISLSFNTIAASAFVLKARGATGTNSRCRLAHPRPKFIDPRLHASFSEEPPDFEFIDELPSSAKDRSLQRLIILIPLISAIGAFATYDNASHAIHAFIQAASQNTWVEADGGKLTAQLLTPAINGPVIVSVSILYATLVSTTISNLYGRQEAIRVCVIKEVEELRFLNQVLEGYPDDSQKEAKCYVDKYIYTLFEGPIMREVTLERVMRNAALGDVVMLLNKLTKLSPTDENAVPGALISQAFDTVTRIHAQRAERIAEIRSTFPPGHYLLLLVLASGICVAFLLETDVEALFFLASFQLRLLWATLIGTFSSLAMVCYDLASPFGGFYSLVKSSDEEFRQFLSYAKNEPID